MREAGKYHIFIDGKFDYMEKRKITKLRVERCKPIWSARLSTGGFGTTGCPAGNRGPKGSSEVILGLGIGGLRELVSLGFIPCAVCRPEKTEEFWDFVAGPVRERYWLSDIRDFADKNVLPYDSRRVSWERIFPMTGTPGRIYLPAALERRDLDEVVARFDRMNLATPPTGFYDISAPSRFRQYDISQ